MDEKRIGVHRCGRKTMLRQTRHKSEAVAAAPAAGWRVRIDFMPDGWIDRDVVYAIIADNVKAELTLS
jgi:hypothetical protein